MLCLKRLTTIKLCRVPKVDDIIINLATDMMLNNCSFKRSCVKIPAIVCKQMKNNLMGRITERKDKRDRGFTKYKAIRRLLLPQVKRPSV